MTRGDHIFARTVSAGAIRSKGGAPRDWQYHPRSDAHSKAACWGIVFDLLASCPLLRGHAAAGRIGFGINHEMRDFLVNRKKNLDLVICAPGNDPEPSSEDFEGLAEKYGIVLEPDERDLLATLPRLSRKSVGTVLVALEAKACMTEHSKACPRLYDELSSSFQTILGDTQNAIAAAFVSINASPEFISPIRNKDEPLAASFSVSYHTQPRDAKRVLDKVRELPRRSGEDELGYDAVGTVFLNCRNDGTEVALVDRLEDGTAIDSILSYSALISRISGIYTSRFRAL